MRVVTNRRIWAIPATVHEAGATLVTSDRGFTRFRSLRLLDPSATP